MIGCFWIRGRGCTASPHSSVYRPPSPRFQFSKIKDLLSKQRLGALGLLCARARRQRTFCCRSGSVLRAIWQRDAKKTGNAGFIEKSSGRFNDEFALPSRLNQKVTTSEVSAHRASRRTHAPASAHHSRHRAFWLCSDVDSHPECEARRTP